MTENIKLPRKLSEERQPPPPLRPSHASVIENLDRWANSPELQPPKQTEEKIPDRPASSGAGHPAVATE
jgi:hypothetical protein